MEIWGGNKILMHQSVTRSCSYRHQCCQDIIPNALIENVDASVVVQKKMKNLNVELIVRGWGVAHPSKHGVEHVKDTEH